MSRETRVNWCYVTLLILGLLRTSNALGILDHLRQIASAPSIGCVAPVPGGHHEGRKSGNKIGPRLGSKVDKRKGQAPAKQAGDGLENSFHQSGRRCYLNFPITYRLVDVYPIVARIRGEYIIGIRYLILIGSYNRRAKVFASVTDKIYAKISRLVLVFGYSLKLILDMCNSFIKVERTEQSMAAKS